MTGCAAPGSGGSSRRPSVRTATRRQISSRAVRDRVLPVAMKVLAKPEKMAWQVEYRHRWDVPVESGELLTQNKRS
jgi:hypothetical protein